MAAPLLDVLLALTRALSRPLGLDDLVHTLLGIVGPAVRADRASLFRVDARTGDLVLHTDRGGPSGARLPSGAGLVGWVVHHRSAVRIDDAAADERFFHGIDETTGYRTHAVLAVPLIDAGGRVVGVLQLLNKPGGFDAADQALIEGLGPVCALAIANADLVDSLEARNRELDRAQQRLRRQHEELAALGQLEGTLLGARDEGVVLQLALDFLVERYGPHDASALLQGERSHVVTAVPGQSAGPVRVRARRISRRWADALLSRFDEPTESADQAVAQLSAPIVVDGARVGALQLLVPADAGESVGMVALVAGAVGRAIRGLRERAVAERDDRLLLVGQMMGGLLHDLRNPLSAIAGYVELLVEEEDPEERRVVAERVAGALAWLESMSQEVLEFSRGTASLAIRTMPLGRFLQELEEIVVPDVARFGTRFERTGDDRGSVRLDAGKMRRVLSNLARNAGEAGAKRVVLRVERLGDLLVFEVADDGPGIHEEIRDRLFQPFATHGKPQGTGLGLAMARRVVEAHGGTIEAPEVPPPGAVLRITLPSAAHTGTPVLG